MAVLVNNQQNQEDDEQQTAPSQGGVVGASAPAATVSAAPAGSGRFTNIQKYIKASGPGAGQKLAGQIGQTVGKQTEKLGKAVESAQGISPQLEAERQRIAQASGFAQQVAQDPTQLAQNPNQLKEFTQLRTGVSAVPTLQQQAQQAFGTAQSQLGQVQNLANLTGSEQGRFELLRQALGRPTYTRGQQKLDQLLLQTGAGNTLGQLQRTTTQQAKAGEELLGSTKRGIESGLSEVGQGATTAQQQLVGALGVMDDPATTDIDESKGAMGGLQQALRQKQQDYIAQQEALKTGIEQSAATDKFTEDTLKALGLTAGQRLYDLKLSDLVKPTFSAENINEQNIANEQDLARYRALAQLAGTDPTYLTEQQVGTAQGTQVDPTNLRAALQSGAQRFTQASSTMLPDLKGKTYDITNPFTDPGLQQYYRMPLYTGRAGNAEDFASYLNQNRAILFDEYNSRGGTTKQAQDWLNRYMSLNPDRRAYIEGSTAGKPLK